MKFFVWFLALALNSLFSSAAKLSFKQTKRSLTRSRPSVLPGPDVLAAASGDVNGIGLDSVHDLIYLSNVTVGDTQYIVQLDTGSSDLWIKGASSPLPNVNDTSTSYNLTYGIGWAFGYLSYASVQFAGISVPNQALIDVSTAQNPALGYGANGILGLGFTALSTIDALVNKTDESTGRSLLFNLFQDNPSQPNFIAFALQRDSDATDDIQGSISVGEYEPEYASVANSTPISTWPISSPSRWNVLVDSFIVHEKTIPVTTEVQGAPSNRAVALLDSGSSYSYAPKYVCDAIYSGINGASFDSTLGQWIVPCDVEIDMAVQIAGQIFPIHPLDMTPSGVVDPSTCVGSFLPQSLAIGAGQFDWLIGDNFLRSVYSIYDFGDFDSSSQMGNPYVRLLSLIDPNAASADFHQARGGTPSTNITYNASGGSSDSPSIVISLSDEVAKSLNLVGILFPAMLVVMALNGLVLLIIIAVGLVYCCKRKKRAAVRRVTNSLRRTRHSRMSGSFHRMSAMPTISVSGEPDPDHPYEPVSMAITDDTVFSSPTPAFRKWEGDPMQPGVDRPRTTIFTGAPPIALALSSSTNHRASVARTEGITANMDYTPPSPGFFQGKNDRQRPKSTTAVDPASPTSPLTSFSTNLRTSMAQTNALKEDADRMSPSPGYFQVEYNSLRSGNTTPASHLSPVPSPTSQVSFTANANDLTQGMDHTPPSPGFFQVEHDSPRSTPTTPTSHLSPVPSPASQVAFTANSNGLTQGMDHMPPSPGFFQVEHDSPRSRNTTPTSHLSPVPSPTGQVASTANANGLTPGMDHTPLSPGFFQVEHERPRSRNASPVSPAPPRSSTTNQRTNTNGLTDGADYISPSPGFFQVEQDGLKSRRTTLVTPPSPVVLSAPPSSSSRTQHSATSPHSAPHTEDITESMENTVPAPAFFEPGQDAPMFPSAKNLRLPPPISTGHRMSVARTEGLTGQTEFRRPNPGFMQGDRPRSLA